MRLRRRVDHAPQSFISAFCYLVITLIFFSAVSHDASTSSAHESALHWSGGYESPIIRKYKAATGHIVHSSQFHFGLASELGHKCS